MISSFIEFFFQIIIGVSNELKQHPTVRKWFTFVSSIALTASIFILVNTINSDNTDNTVEKQLATIFALVSFYFSLIAITSFTSLNSFKLNDTEIALEAIRKERQEIREYIEEKPSKKEDVFDIVRLSLNQLLEYYTINKNQAVKSFNFSVSAIILGFASLVFGIWLFYLQEEKNITLATIASISGLLIQFIGSANFYVYNKSINQLNFFYAQLIRTQETMLSIRLCEKISDEYKQIATMEKIILALIERNSIMPTMIYSQSSGFSPAKNEKQKKES